MIHGAHASINVVHVRVEEPADVLDVLAECVADRGGVLDQG
jgi:hypothetical protein